MHRLLMSEFLAQVLLKAASRSVKLLIIKHCVERVYLVGVTDMSHNGVSLVSLHPELQNLLRAILMLPTLSVVS